MARDARYLGLCCRIAAELGAPIVKTYYCEGFEEVVGGSRRSSLATLPPWTWVPWHSGLDPRPTQHRNSIMRICILKTMLHRDGSISPANMYFQMLLQIVLLRYLYTTDSSRELDAYVTVRAPPMQVPARQGSSPLSY